MIQKIKDQLLSHVVTIGIGMVGALLLFVGKEVLPPVLPVLLGKMPSRAILALLALSIILNIALLVIVLLVRKQQRLKVMFGIYWDSDNVPHCPSCKSMLCNYDYYRSDYGGFGFYCIKCGKFVAIQDESGQNIPLPEALARLKA